MESNKSRVQSFSNTNMDFNQISLNIRRRSYNYLGSGSGRVVFDLGNGNVVKVAKNRKGIAQNEAEYKIALTNNSNFFAKILQVSEGFTLLIMEKAEKIRDISDVWEYFNVKSSKEFYQIKELKDVCERHNLGIKDFGRAVNWGKVNGKPIIIDYGFTQQVRWRFYMSMASRIFKRYQG